VRDQYSAGQLESCKPSRKLHSFFHRLNIANVERVMLTWVVYDIVKDKPRTTVAKECLRAGIQRVQFSVFLGELNQNAIDELGLKIKSLIDEETDRVYIFPMCKEDFSKVRLLGQAFDKKMVTDELRELFL